MIFAQTGINYIHRELKNTQAHLLSIIYLITLQACCNTKPGEKRAENHENRENY